MNTTARTAGTPAPSRPSTQEPSTMTTPGTLTTRTPRSSIAPFVPPGPAPARSRSTRLDVPFVPVERDPAPEPIERRPAGSWDVLPRAAVAAWGIGGTYTFLIAAPDGYPVVTFAYTATWAALSALTAGAYLNHRTSTSKTVRPILAPLLRLLAGGALRAPLSSPAPAPPALPVVLMVDEMAEFLDHAAARPAAVPVPALDERPVVVGVVVSDVPTDLPNTYVPATAQEATR